MAKPTKTIHVVDKAALALARFFGRAGVFVLIPIRVPKRTR